jgi:hypothetical protein
LGHKPEPPDSGGKQKKYIGSKNTLVHGIIILKGRRANKAEAKKSAAVSLCHGGIGV